MANEIEVDVRDRRRKSSPFFTPLTTLRLVLAVLAAGVGTYGVAETDIWGHLRFGLDLLHSWRLPFADSYSFTSSAPWINHEWASQLLLAAAYDLGGLTGLALLRALVASACVAVLAVAVRRTAWPLRDVVVVATVAAASPILRSVRPQALSVPLYTLTLVGLSREAWWLPLVFVAWANLHGGWLLGLGAVAVWAGCRPSRRRLLIAAACAAATLANPYGIGLWRALAEAVLRGWADVAEWQPITTFSLGTSDAALWMATCAAAAWAARRSRPSFFAATWTVLVAIAAFRVRRHVPFFAVTTAVLLFAPIRGREPSVSGNSWTRDTAAAVMTVGCLSLALIAWALWPTFSCLPTTPRFVRPESSAVQYIRSSGLRGRVVIWFDWGLYAIWQVGDRLQVSMDNRRETVYSAKMVADHDRFYDGRDPRLPDRVGADFVWLPPGLPAVRQLIAQGWSEAYAGPRSVILARSARGTPVVGREDGHAPCFPNP